MRTTGYGTTRSGTMAYRAYARTRNQRIGYAQLMLVSVATAGLIGLGVGVGVASLDRPLAGRHCSGPDVTTHDATGLTLSCGPASTGNRELVWPYAPAS